jgi:hypothetical protein
MSALRIPGVLQHPKGPRGDVDLQKEVRAHFDAHAGVRFLVEVLGALHASPAPIRTAEAFVASLPPKVTMRAFEARADLRARVVHALTGAPQSLMRRMPLDAVIAQIELLVERDLPPEERSVRAEDDRNLSVSEIYLKHIDPTDLAAYVPPADLWAYERKDEWWTKSNASNRRMMAAELKSIRRHRILSDTEILDTLGDDAFERDLPVKVRAALRGAARKAAAEKRPFTDTDLFEHLKSQNGARDLVDDLVESVSLAHLRKIIARAATVVGLEAAPDEERSLMQSIAPSSGPNGEIVGA